MSSTSLAQYNDWMIIAANNNTSYYTVVEAEYG